MSTKITQELVAMHEQLTQEFLDGRITHDRRVATLKALGITGAQNIDLDNRYGEKYLGESEEFEDNE